MEMNSVTVLEECQVSPPTASVPPTSLPLAIFDLIFLGMPLGQFLFYYAFHNSKTHFITTIVPKMKQCLALTLQLFFPLAGKLVWRQESTKPELFFEDGNAVLFVVAESEQEFSEFSGNHARDPNIFYPLSPVLRSSIPSDISIPLLALQVTLFPNQGICLGATFNHVAADGATINHFMKSWASICRLEGDAFFNIKIDVSPPYINRSIVNHLKPKELIYLNALEKFNLTKDTFHSLTTDHMIQSNICVQATFLMGRSMIKQLRHLVSTHAITKGNIVIPPLRFSSFVITCAYVWVCMLKARWGVENSAGNAAKEYIIVPVDAREKLDPPLPVTYFGNCVVGLEVMAMRSDLLSNDGIFIAAMSIVRAIQNLNVKEQIGKPLSHYISMPPEQCLVVAGSPKFGMYETDFGWGKPKKIEMTLLASGNSMSVFEFPNEAGAMEIVLSVSPTHLNSFASQFGKSLPSLSLM